MNDDMVPIRIPSTTIFRTSVLDFLPGQVASALMKRPGFLADETALAIRTRVICERIVEELQKSPLWKPAVVFMPPQNNGDAS